MQSESAMEKNFVFCCCDYSPMNFYYSFENICKHKVDLSEESLSVLFRNKMLYDQHYTYTTILFNLIEKYNYYEKNLYNLIKYAKDNVHDLHVRKYIKRWLEKSRKYCILQLNKNKKYNNDIPITKHWYNSRILEPKLAGVIGSYI